MIKIFYNIAVLFLIFSGSLKGQTSIAPKDKPLEPQVQSVDSLESALWTPDYFDQFELRQDNDFLHFTDRYYSTGSFLGLHRWLPLTPKQLEQRQTRQYSLVLYQEIYTPTDLLTDKIKFLDRPYAGFIGLNNGLTVTRKAHLNRYNFVFGIAGPWSGSETVQSAFHNSATVDSKIATWLSQIDNSFHLNAYYEYVREWQWNPKPFAVYFALNPKAALGTKDAFVEQDAVFYFGRRSSLQKTMAYGQLLGRETELFFSTRFGYRYVLHDAMLQGNWLGDNSVYTVTPYRMMYFFNVGFFWRYKRNDVFLKYHYESARNRSAEPHLYVSLSYSRRY
jgi:hypothetical protein